MSAQKLNSIRLAIVVSCLAAVLGICLPKFFLPVAGAEAALLSASPSSPQSEDIEELLQQLEAVKEQLDGSGPTDELMQQYQKLLDQINDLTDQGMGLQRRMDKTKEITDDSSGSGSVSNKKKKRKGQDNSGGGFQVSSGPSSLCIPGSLAAGDPTYNRVRTQTTGSGVQSPCSLLPSANNARYDAYELEITDCTTFPTNVTITLCGPAGCSAPQALDTVLYVYRTGGLSGAGGAAHPFNPGDPCSNVVASNDDLSGVAVGPGGSSGGVPSCPTSGALSGLKRSLGSGKFVVVVTGFSNTTAGNYNLYIDAPDGGCTITQVAGCPVISISPASIPPGTINTAYTPVTFTATGGVGPYTFTQTGTLPTGMSFVGDTLSGTPTQAGGFPIQVTATDANGCGGGQAYSLVITNPALPCITDGLFAGGPTYNRPNAITTGTGVSSPCTLSPTGTAVFYKAYEFNVTGCTTGTLTATLCGPPSCPPITNSTSIPDSIIYLYRVGGLTGPGGTPGAFNPLLPCVNLVAANDDLSGVAVGVGGSSGGLTACSAKTSLSGLRRTIGSGSFVIVVASFSNNQTGAYNLSVDITGCTISQCFLTCPANVTTGNDVNQCGAIVVYPAPTTNGGCGVVTCIPPSGSFFPVGTTTVTCTATAGPSCSFTVTVNDTQAPTITCPANVTTSADPNQCSAVVTYSNATATDNCPGVGTPSCTPASGSTFPTGTTTVTCTVSDASGNSASCTFTVTVNDPQPPTITCPANVIASTDPNQCSAVVNYSNATATDNCPGVGTPTCTPASGSAFPKGTTTVTCTVNDASGNSASCTFTVTVNDTQAPAITCPANVTASTDPNQCSAVVTYSNATATDNCPGVGTPSCSPASGSTFAKGTTTVTCTVSDASGNSASCTFTVTVNDTQPPAITCPANVTASADPNQCSAAVTYSNATAIDNCPGVGTPSCTPASGSTFPTGTTTVTCTVSDASGNSANCTFTVTVNDNQPPTITCPSNIVTNTAPGQCAQVVTFSASASDNCPGVTTICTPPSGSTFPKGTTPVSCTATDASGNTATCSFNVTVNDNEIPMINCPANITTPAGQLVCYAVVTYTATATDNCPGVTVSCAPPSGSQFPIGTTSVACTATDTSGNTNSCGFTVTVTNPDPVVTITGPPSGSVYAVGQNINFTGTFTDAGGGTHTAVWTFTSANPTINQPGVVVEGTGSVSLTYSFSAAGVYFVKLTVNDSCGGSGFSTTVDGLDAMVVIFDSESFVTGGGWINSPAGAFIANPSLTGRASFGFNAKYHNGLPTGQTEFKFKEGDLNFHSTSYDWLVVTGARAQYQGSGTINGSGNYGFMVTVIDGQAPGGGGVDRFRIKIWDKNNGNAVVYDTQPGDPDSANPTLALGSGSIVIH